MPRVSVSLTKPMHVRLSILANQENDSLSHLIGRLIQIGLYHFDKEETIIAHPVEQHCQQLIIQMNALIKNISVELLKLDQNDFEKLRDAAIVKYHELKRLSIRD